MSRQSKALSRYLSHVAAAAALAVAAPSLADIAVPGQPYHPHPRPMPEPPPVATPVMPAVPLLASDYTPASLAAACDAAEKAALGKLDLIGKLTPAEQSFDSTFLAYEQAMADYGDAVGRLAFMKDVHPNPEVRKAGAECEERGGKFAVQVGARKDLYLAMKGYLAGKGATERRDAIDVRLETLTLRDFRRNGLELKDKDREKLVQIRSKLAELATKFSANLGANTDSIEATQAELAGLPDSYIARLKKTKDGKKFVVTTKYPDYFPLMENAKDEGVRKRMYFAFNGREAKTNMPLLAQAIALRDEAAKLLGYKNHADFVTEDRMAKTSATVADFLTKLQAELKPRRDADMAKMQAIKAAETGNPKAIVQDWDWLYCLNQIKKRDFTIDDEAVRAYFPSDKVMAGMFQVYSTLLGVTFTEVPGVTAWSPTVKLYEVHDTASQKLLAYFYTDLYPREGKYGHAASFPIGVARALPNGGYQVPLSALVCNFNAPENGKPAFWAISEVDTLFHEFGHIMHASLTTARYNSMGGTNVATDFVEAPSQMLENWVFRSEVLKLVSQDPKDPTKTLPEDLVTRIVGARKFDAGIKYTRQVFLASFDQALHTRGAKVNPDAVDHELRGTIMGFPVNKDEHFAATFGHLMGGYDAGYYGYLWSEVFAADMFTRFEKDGVLNPALGKQYRDIILAKGREEDPEQLLKEFLGRDPNQDAFLRMTGLK